MNYKIFQNGEQINTIVADEAFVTSYCKDNGYTYEAVEPTPEPEPEQEELPDDKQTEGGENQNGQT